MDKLRNLLFFISSLSIFLVLYIFQNNLISYITQVTFLYCLLALFFLILPFLFTSLSLRFVKNNITDYVERIKSIKRSYETYLIAYFSLYFVVLSVSNLQTFMLLL